MWRRSRLYVCEMTIVDPATSSRFVSHERKNCIGERKAAFVIRLDLIIFSNVPFNTDTIVLSF